MLLCWLKFNQKDTDHTKIILTFKKKRKYGNNQLVLKASGVCVCLYTQTKQQKNHLKLKQPADTLLRWHKNRKFKGWSKMSCQIFSCQPVGMTPRQTQQTGFNGPFWVFFKFSIKFPSICLVSSSSFFFFGFSFDPIRTQIGFLYSLSNQWRH